MRTLSVKFGRPRYTGPPQQFRRPTHPEHLNLCRGGQPQGRSLGSGTLRTLQDGNGFQRLHVPLDLRGDLVLGNFIEADCRRESLNEPIAPQWSA